MRSCVAEKHRSSAFVDGYAGERGLAAERAWIAAGMPPVLPLKNEAERAALATAALVAWTTTKGS